MRLGVLLPFWFVFLEWFLHRRAVKEEKNHLHSNTG